MPIIVLAIIMSCCISMTSIPSYFRSSLRRIDISQNDILVAAVTTASISYGVFRRWFGQSKIDVVHKKGIVEKDVARKTSKNTVTTRQPEIRTRQHIGSSNSKSHDISGHIRNHVSIDEDDSKVVTTKRQAETKHGESSLSETRGVNIDKDSINSGSVSTTCHHDDEDGKFSVHTTNSQNIRPKAMKTIEPDEISKSSINNIYSTNKDSRLQDVYSFSSSDDGLPLSPTGYISFLPESSTRTEERTAGSSTHTTTTLHSMNKELSGSCDKDRTSLEVCKDTEENLAILQPADTSVSDTGTMEITLDSSLSSMMHDITTEMEEANKRMRRSIKSLNTMKVPSLMELENLTEGVLPNCDNIDLATGSSDSIRLAIARMRRPIVEMDDDDDDEVEAEAEANSSLPVDTRDESSSFFE